MLHLWITFRSQFQPILMSPVEIKLMMFCSHHHPTLFYPLLTILCQYPRPPLLRTEKAFLGWNFGDRIHTRSSLAQVCLLILTEECARPITTFDLNICSHEVQNNKMCSNREKKWAHMCGDTHALNITHTCQPRGERDPHKYLANHRNPRTSCGYWSPLSTLFSTAFLPPNVGQTSLCIFHSLQPIIQLRILKPYLSNV